MAIHSALFDIALKILGQNYNRTYTIEELTAAVYGNEPLGTVFLERERQAKVLETLLLLEAQGLIVLHPLTDESRINLKGLIRQQISYFVN